MDMKIVTEFPWTDAAPGDRCTIDLVMTTITNVPRTDATPGERCTIGLIVSTATDLHQLDATPGDRYTCFATRSRQFRLFPGRVRTRV